MEGNSQLNELLSEIKELKKFVQQEQAMLYKELTESLKQQIKIQNDFSKYLIENNSQLLQQVLTSNKLQQQILANKVEDSSERLSTKSSPLKVIIEKEITDPPVEQMCTEQADSSIQEEYQQLQQEEVSPPTTSEPLITDEPLASVSSAEIDTSYGQTSNSEIVDSHQYIEDDEIQGEEYQERIREAYVDKEEESETTYFVVSNEETEIDEIEKELSLDMKESKESLPADSTVESANSSILGPEAKNDPQTLSEKIVEMELNLSPIITKSNNCSIVIETQAPEEADNLNKSIETNASTIEVDPEFHEVISTVEIAANTSNIVDELDNQQEITPQTEDTDPLPNYIEERREDTQIEEENTEPAVALVNVSREEVSVEVPVEKKVSPSFDKNEENEEIEIQVDDDDDDSVEEKLAVTAQHLIDLCTLCLISEDNENLRNIDVSYFEFKNALEVFKNSTVITDLTEMIDHEKSSNEKPHLLPILFFCRGSILYEMAAVLPASSQKHLIRDAKQDFTAIIALENQFQVVNDPMYQRFMAVTYFQRSIILENESNYERAVADLDASISKYSRFIEAYYRRAALYKNKFSKYQEALNDLSKIIELNPRDYECYFKRGLMLQNKFKNPELALVEYRKSIELNPNFASAYNNIGILYYDTFQKYDLALEYFTKAIEMKENHAPFYKNRGRLYLHKLNEVEKALEDFTKAIELNNQDDESYLLRAWLYEHKLGQLDKAQQDTHKAQEINPKAAAKLLPKDVSPVSKSKQSKRAKKERTPKKSPK